MRNYYRRTAELYDQKWKSYTNRTLGKVMQYLPDSLRGQHVLDVGCGTGELIRSLLRDKPEVARVVGYDPVDNMLQQARSKLQRLPAQLSDKVKLQNHKNFDGQFDIIVSTSVLHYLPDPQTELHALKQLLKDEGRLILLDYTKNSLPARYMEWAIRWIDAMHQQAYTPRQISELIARAGFTLRREETFSITCWWQGAIVEATA